MNISNNVSFGKIYPYNNPKEILGEKKYDQISKKSEETGHDIMIIDRSTALIEEPSGDGLELKIPESRSKYDIATALLNVFELFSKGKSIDAARDQVEKDAFSTKKPQAGIIDRDDFYAAQLEAEKAKIINRDDFYAAQLEAEKAKIINRDDHYAAHLEAEKAKKID